MGIPEEKPSTPSPPMTSALRLRYASLMSAPDPRANPTLLGHPEAEDTILEAIRAERMHHAWLITGPEGVGKATLAYRFARRLLAGHLIDVESSDQHTVKPWFAGRSNLSPSVIDLAADGFPLIGGRLDLVAGRPVPALVYKRRQHIINLFVLPVQPNGHSSKLARHGYNLVHWDEGDLSLWAVSDAAPSELAEFAKLYRAATGR